MGRSGVKGSAYRIKLQGGISGHAFFFDFDGTLVDIAPAPDLISADSWLLDLMRRLQKETGGALALISGRTVAEVDRLFAPIRLPIAGQHGAERRDAAGAMHYHPHSASQLDSLRRCVSGLAAEAPDLLIEDKGMSIAVHYRRVPQLAARVQQKLEECMERSGDGFRLQAGKMVMELKPAGKDKGTAIMEYMDEAPFRGRVPIFIGDDATDEFGFGAVNRLGGYSIKVGPGDSAAPWRIPDVAAVRAWMEKLLNEAARMGDCK